MDEQTAKPIVKERDDDGIEPTVRNPCESVHPGKVLTVSEVNRMNTEGAFCDEGHAMKFLKVEADPAKSEFYCSTCHTSYRFPEGIRFGGGQ